MVSNDMLDKNVRAAALRFDVGFFDARDILKMRISLTNNRFFRTIIQNYEI